MYLTTNSSVLFGLACNREMAGPSIKPTERWPEALVSQRIRAHSTISVLQLPPRYTVAGLPAPKSYTIPTSPPHLLPWVTKKGAFGKGKIIIKNSLPKFRNEASFLYESLRLRILLRQLKLRI